MSYALEEHLSKHPERFGKGAIEGVAGPEAANNAASSGVLVSLLTLGLPTSASAAIMLAAFQQFGLQPGPLLFQTSPEVVWGLIASLYLGNVMLLVLNLPLVGLWCGCSLSRTRSSTPASWYSWRSATYSLSNSLVDIVTLFVIGFAGFLMRRFFFLVAPAVVGMILGLIAEQQFRRALSISQGVPGVSVREPLAATFLLLALAAMLVPALWPLVRRART